MRRLVCKSNGISYPIQKGALAFYSPEGQKQTRQQIALYQTSAQILREGMLSLGYSLVGGIDAPYIWVKIPSRQTSWEFFQILLHRCHLLAMPGSGFGSQGEGFMRFSCFIQPAIAQEAVCRLQALSTEKSSLITGSI
jgi:LL-diaminopimelate aminotransferase